MPKIDDWSDCLSAEMREVWPLLAQATRRMRGSLMGGTALAVHLRHRASFDLDFMTMQTFSGAGLARSLEKHATDFQLIDAGTDTMHARVQTVLVQVFQAPRRGLKPGHVKAPGNPQVRPCVGVSPDGLRTKDRATIWCPTPPARSTRPSRCSPLLEHPASLVTSARGIRQDT